MVDEICADCAGWHIEWMYTCEKHKVKYCKTCECPLCAEEEEGDDYPPCYYCGEDQCDCDML